MLQKLLALARSAFRVNQIPNWLTLTRGLVLTPVIGSIFIWYSLGFYGITSSPEEYFPFRSWALILTLLAIVTDTLDGLLAKTFDWKSTFGAKVDPLMDKFFSYMGLTIVPLYYGLGWYLLWFAPLAWYVDRYSRKTTRMRARGEILEANVCAQRKQGFLFASQMAFVAAIAIEDTRGLIGETALWYADMFMFTVAAATMAWAAKLCMQAMKLYEVQAEIVRAERARTSTTLDGDSTVQIAT